MIFEFEPIIAFRYMINIRVQSIIPFKRLSEVKFSFQFDNNFFILWHEKNKIFCI